MQGSITSEGYGRKMGLPDAYAVESANHSFGGGTDILFRETEAALEWIQRVKVDREPAAAPSASPILH